MKPASLPLRERAGLWEKLALVSRRMGTQLRDHHDDAQRAGLQASQPDADGPRPRDMEH
jgi:hypothetical protein